MTSQEKREQWRFYVRLFFTDTTAQTQWEKGFKFVIKNASDFADLCVGAENSRFDDLRPDPPPPLPLPSSPGAPYR